MTTFGIDEECNTKEELMGPLLRGGQGGTRQAVAYALAGSMINRQDHNGPNGSGIYMEHSPTLTKSDRHTVAFAQNQRDEVRLTDVAGALAAEPGMKQQTYVGVSPAATDAYGFQPRIARNGRGDMGDVVGALNAQSGETGKGDAAPCVATPTQVRRLMPVECERLQGFPDGYTDIKPNGKPTPDGPRYKALGNSFAVPVVRWIGERIQMVEDIKNG